MSSRATRVACGGLCLMMASLVISPAPASAGPHYHGGHGGWFWALPAAAVALTVAGLTYYSYNGAYYRPAPGGYVMVPPPAPMVYTAPAEAYPAPPSVMAGAPSVGSVVVTSPTLNLRTGPGYNYPVVAVVQGGSTLSVLTSNGAWLSVQTEEGQMGWVAAKFTRPVEGAPAG